MKQDTTPQLIVYGTNHHQADMETREKVTLNASQVDLLYSKVKLKDHFAESLILNTCNRTELYLLEHQEPNFSEVRDLLSEVTDTPQEIWTQIEVSKCGADAVQHCLQVAAGLNSQMIGETEILGQVKQAYQRATNEGTAGKILHQLFQQTFRVGKWIRTNTSLGKGQVSAPTVAARLAERIYGKLDRAQAMVLGTGEMAEAMIKVLISEGLPTPAFAGRNRDRADEIARMYQADTIAFEHWKTKLPKHEILITSTLSSEWMLTESEIRKIMSQRKGRPLFIIDLAMPRDVEPKAANLDGVYLYNLDDLAKVANENLQSRQAEIQRCHEYVHQESAEIWDKIRDRYEASADSAVTSVESSGRSGG
ncbi:MAG: glutamyl-tRNA reductase [Verrucomicrobiota bacterium]